MREFMDIFKWFRTKEKGDDDPIVIEDIENITDNSAIKEINNDLPKNIRHQVSSHPFKAAPKPPQVPVVEQKVTQIQESTVIESPKQEVVVEEVPPTPTPVPAPKPKRRYDDGFTSCRNMY